MIVYVLLLALAAVVFNLTLPIMAGLYIVSDLGGDSYLSAYGVSFFCIGNILSVPLGKPWITRLNAIQLYILCLCFMIIFSWQCAVATDYFRFILFRFLEGFASGPIYLVITYTLIPQLVPPKKKAFIMSLVLICFANVPVIAASWGGWIAFYHNWRFLFYANIPICLFLIVYVGYRFRNYHKTPEKIVFDKVGYLFYLISITFIGTALTVGQELDWFRSSLISFLLIAGSISTVFFILRSLSFTQPILDLKLFKNLYFCFAMLNVGLIFAIYFGMVVLLSLWLKLYVNYTPNWIILLISTMALGAWIPAFINYKQYDPRLPLAIALLFLAISCFYTTNFNVEINFARIAVSRGMAAIGLALFLVPLFHLSTQSFKPEKLAECLSLFHVVRLLGSGLGVALFLILWHRRQVFYHERLGSRLTEFSQITTQFFHRAQQFNIEGKQALAQLNFYLNRQATALALDDCFYLMGWMLVALLIILFATFLFHTPVLFNKGAKSKEKQESNLPPAPAVS